MSDAPRRKTGLERLLERVRGEGEVAPVHEWLGIRWLEVGEGVIVVEMDVKPEFSNTWEVIQGGILSTIADTACAGAGLTACREDEAIATLDLHVHYVRPARLDVGVLRATGRLIHRSARNAHSEGEVTGADGRILAKATATLAIRHLD